MEYLNDNIPQPQPIEPTNEPKNYFECSEQICVGKPDYKLYKCIQDCLDIYVLNKYIN